MNTFVSTPAESCQDSCSRWRPHGWPAPIHGLYVQFFPWTNR